MARASRQNVSQAVKLGRGRRWATAIDLGTYSVKIATIGTDDAGQLSINRITVEPLPPTPEDVPEELALTARRTEALRKALQKHGHLKGRVVLGLSRSLTTIRYLTLPSADPAELRTMLFYDIERHVPFPVETLEIDFEVLEQTGDHESLIMMVSSLREEILAHLDICAEAGLRPDAVDVDILGACAAYARDQSPEGTDVILDLGRESTRLGVVSHGFVLFSRSLPIAENRLLEAFPGARRWDDLQTRFASLASLPPHERGAIEDWANRLSMEIMRSVSSFRCEPYGRPVDRLILCGGAGYLPTGSNALGVRLRSNAVIQPPLNGDIPPSPDYHGTELATVIGLGQRALQPATDHVNLIPQEVVRQRQQREKKSFMVNVAILMMLGLGMLGATGYFRYREKAAELTQLNDRYQELKPQVDELEKMEREIEVVESYLDNEHSCLTVLYNVLSVLPDQWPNNVSVSSLDFDKKKKTLAIAGQVMSSERVDLLSVELRKFQQATPQRVAIFKSVTEQNRTRKPLNFGGHVAWDFEFECELVSKEPPSSDSRSRRAR